MNMRNNQPRRKIFIQIDLIQLQNASDDDQRKTIKSNRSPKEIIDSK